MPAPGLTRETGGPTRLHHNAYVCADQARTRHFYEDLAGMPLTQFWIEDEMIGGERHVYSHAFYGLEDGGALAFFNFADPVQQARYTPRKQELFVHISLKVDRATQAAIRGRFEAEGIEVWEADHGYTFSIYITDPDGLLVEFSVDPSHIAAIEADQRRTAHAALARWVDGSRITNNDVRHG